MIAIAEVKSFFEGLTFVEEYCLDIVPAAGVLSVVLSEDFEYASDDDFSFSVTNFGLPMVSFLFGGEVEEIATLKSLVERVIKMDSFQEDPEFLKRQIFCNTMRTFGISEDDLEDGLKISLKDLVAAIQLFREGVCTFREAVEIAKQ